MAGGQTYRTLHGHTEEVRGLAFTRDGSLLSGDEDGRIIHWSLDLAAATARICATTGRDLLPPTGPKVKVTAPLVLADPDFDLAPAKVRAEAKRLLGRAAGDDGPTSVSGALRLGDQDRLPGTGDEARVIAPSLKRYAGMAPRVFTREQALVAVFRAARSPRVVVLCTHGSGGRNWQEEGVVEEARSRFGKPVTHLVVN